ncbi:uncharacterized protein LOC126291959 isoform X2 [Schistocerca gregaria]|uniref:uncharacterized protein LOC126291959 isoform X2 n=1 Tax=Schistocerca gregaria TaxID=7010 RepID=UPI00211E73DD|nr:uncharacterized protein LOC126291959 isoform X2 [Schistocerca gregaria]XP_049841672.1 uncharacterized protein LOC126291959 isoform X2 [Schistocerca gregaria]
MAASFLKMAVRRHCRLDSGCRSQFSIPALASFLVMVLTTTHPSSAKRLRLGDGMETADSRVLQRQNIVEGHLHTGSTPADDAELLLTLLPGGEPELPDTRFLHEVREGDRGPHLHDRAPSPTGKDEEELQPSLNEYKVSKKPYRKILDGHGTVVEQLHTTVWDSNKLVNDGNPADAEGDGNSNLDSPYQEMAESVLSGEHEESNIKRSVRLPRSPVTSRDFLGFFSSQNGYGVDEAQEQRPFHVSTGYDSSESSVNPHVVNNQQQYLQEGQWNIHTPQNTHASAVTEALYPLHQRNLLQIRNGREKIFPQTPLGGRASFGNGEYAPSALGREYIKNTFPANLRNFISQANVSQKKTLQNKKRDLSRQHVTLGENVEPGTSQKPTLYRSSALEEFNRNGRPILENAITRMVMGGEGQWDRIATDHFSKLFQPVSHNEAVSLSSQHSVPVAVSEQVVSILPIDDKPSEYDHTTSSVSPVEDLGGSIDEGALVLETSDQQRFWLEGESGLLHDNIFIRPDYQSGLNPTMEPHVGIRIFKRSVGTGGLRKGGVPHLVKMMQEGAGSHTSAALSKRSPLSTGYVAGITADVDHHQHHEHMAVAATGAAHHHDSSRPRAVEEHHADAGPARQRPTRAGQDDDGDDGDAARRGAAARGARRRRSRGAAPPPSCFPVLHVHHDRPQAASHTQPAPRGPRRLRSRGRVRWRRGGTRLLCSRVTHPLTLTPQITIAI